MAQIKRFLPAILILIALAVALYFVDQDLIFQTIRENREAMLSFVAENRVLSALIFVAGYALAVAISIPGAVFFTLLGGFLFGTVGGGTLVVIAATLGALAIFYIAKTALGETLKSRIGPSFERIAEGFQRDGASYMLVMRLVPIFPFWVVNLVPALLGVSTKVFVIATFFGIMPASFVYASLGAGLGAILDAGGEPNLGIIFQPQILLPILGLAVLALVPVAYKRWSARKSDPAVPQP